MKIEVSEVIKYLDNRITILKLIKNKNDILDFNTIANKTNIREIEHVKRYFTNLKIIRREKL